VPDAVEDFLHGGFLYPALRNSMLEP
jgi:hypothetical protein